MDIQNITVSSFGSTYQIALVQPGINKAKRVQLKEFAQQFENHAFPNGNNGNVRISVEKSLDTKVEQGLQQLKFKVYKKFAEHNLSAADGSMDRYIERQAHFGDYKQSGKQKKKTRKRD